MPVAILTDLTKCSGCQACVWACKEQNGLPKSGPIDKLSATTWTSIRSAGGLNIRRHCMHCLEPACVSVCPVGALQKTAQGPVTYDPDKCLGCRYCMVGCPFFIPRYEWTETAPRVRKCIMCFDKAVSRGEQPACTSVCPTGATQFGERDALIALARRRIAAAGSGYVDDIYGLDEAGGTSVLYLSSVPFAELGFGERVGHDPYPRLTWNVLSKLPNVVSVGGVLMLGIWWIGRRKEEVARAEGTSHERGEE